MSSKPKYHSATALRSPSVPRQTSLKSHLCSLHLPSSHSSKSMQSGSYSITLLRQLLFRPAIISSWCCINFILLCNKLPQIYCPKKQFISVSLDQDLTLRSQFSSVQSLSHVQLFANPWIAAHQASLSITNSRSLLKLMSIESVIPSSHLILCRSLLLLPPILPIIRVFSNESTLPMRWPKYWSFSFSIIPSKEHSGLMSLRSHLTLISPSKTQSPSKNKLGFRASIYEFREDTKIKLIRVSITG